MDFVQLKGKKMLVVGGAGFVGSNLVKAILKQEPQEVVVVDNLLSAERVNIPDDKRVFFVQGSIADDAVLQQIKGVTPKPVSIPWMVDEQFFTPGEDRPQDGKTVFFTLAAMIEAKGIRDLLMAIKKLADNLPTERRKSVSFRLGGGGLQLGEFQRLCSEMGLDGYVEWLGTLPREQVRDELRSCDCFVLPSRFDTFSVVCAEALACGRPVIATRCGGPNSIVTDGLGLLSGVGDIDGLAENMRKVVTGEIIFSSGKIRNNFMARFSREVVAQKWEKIFVGLTD